MMALVALTQSLVPNHAGSHLLNNSSGGVASGVLLRALGIPRICMQRRALSATAKVKKEPLVSAYRDSYRTSGQIKGGAALLFRKDRLKMDLSKMGEIVVSPEGHKMEMKQLSEGLKSLMMSLIITKDEDEAAQDPVTKKNKRIVRVLNRDFDDDKLDRELSRRHDELFERPDIKENLEKFFPGMDPYRLVFLPLPPDTSRAAKAFLKQMDAEIDDIGLSLKIMIRYDPVTDRFLPPR